MPNFKLGFQGVTYYSATPLNCRPTDDPLPGSPIHHQNATWLEIDNVSDVNVDAESDKVDTTTRAEAKVGWQSEVATTKKGQLSTTIRWKPGDAAFNVLLAAWLFSKEIAILDLDGPANEAGAQGIVANFTPSFGIKKPVKGIMTVEVTLSISSFPDWVVVGAGPGFVLAAVTDT